MESECIYGEGIDYIFPEEECNPFREQTLGKYPLPGKIITFQVSYI